MTRKIINVGTADKGNGDPLRVAFSKANDNFAELYNILSNNTGGSIITTDVIGSVFADDSTLLVDGINGSIPYSVLSGAPTIPAAQVQSNWTAASGMGVILNKPTFATVATTGAYADLTGKPTLFSGSYNDLTDKPNNIAGTYQFSVAADDSTQRVISNNELIKFIGAGTVTTASDAEGNITITGSGGSSLVNGAHQVALVVGGAGPYVTFPADDGVSIGFQGGDIGIIGGEALLYSTEYGVRLTANSTGTRKDWEFATDGSLTLPGDLKWPSGGGNIRSDGNINIEINLGDSTLRRWRFGEDGELTIPGSIIGTATIEINNRDSGNTADINLYSADDILIQARDREGDSGSEGGDINIYAGDSAVGSDATGGDVQIRGGDGGAGDGYDNGGDGGFVTINGGNGGAASGIYSARNGGYLTLRAGNAGNNGGNIDLGAEGGNVTINAGNSTGNGLNGGTIYLTSGAADASALAGDVVIQAGGTWTFGGDGALTIPGDIKSNGNINIDINLTDSTLRRWQFGEDGNLTLPSGGNISEGGGLSGAIKLTPAGGANANQALLIYPTAAAEGDHIHLTAGGGSTELYLGDDFHFVKLTSDGFVVIKADDGVNGAVWGFSPDGTTSIPGNIKSDSNINIEINLSDSTLRRWQFGEDGILTLPSTGKISNSGYDWTFGSNGSLTFPDNTISTGKGITIPEDQSLTVNLSYSSGPVLATAFKINPRSIKLPEASGIIFAGTETNAGEWGLDSGNRTLRFPDAGDYVYPQIRYSNAGDPGTGMELITGNKSIKITADTKSWTFGTDGDLKIPGNIKSDGNINIDINLSDSTLRRWHFGEDGELTVPGPISGLGNAKLDFTTYANVAYLTSTDNDFTALYMGSVSAELYAQTNILIRTNTDGASKQWTFGDDGSLTLPGEITLTNGAVIKDTANEAVAFGSGAGTISQGGEAVAIGVGAGQNSQGGEAVAIGSGAASEEQGINAVAIGYSAGRYNQGANAVAIGKAAGLEDQAANSIIINATGATLDQTTANTFTVKPVRQGETADAMYYNSSTGEITYADAFSFSVAADDSTQRAISNNESIKFIGAGKINTASDAEGNITITGADSEGSWTVTTGTNTYSFTVPMDGTYVMWVKGNIPNGIITWNATLSVTNSNVPAIGYQYAWNYTGGGSPILLTSIPDQIRGTAGNISTDATYVGSTSNRFDFGISNTSGASQTVYYGYTRV